MWQTLSFSFSLTCTHSSFVTYTRHKWIKNMTPCSMYSFQSVLEEMSNMFAVQRFICCFRLYHCKKLTYTTYSHKLLCNFLLDLLSHFSFPPSVFACCVQCVCVFSLSNVLSFSVSFFLHTLYKELAANTLHQKRHVLFGLIVELIFFAPNKSWKWAAW